MKHKISKMSKLIFSVLMLTTLMLLVLSINASATTLTVPNDYGTIQAAIDAANSGDTVFVKPGTYYEHLIIHDKSITLQGEDKATTIIDGSGTGTVIEILTNEVTISGLTVVNSGRIDDGRAGIAIGGSQNIIEDTLVHSNAIGIRLADNAQSCMISDSDIYDNSQGISIWRTTYAGYTSILRNKIRSNDIGIHFKKCGSDNRIAMNQIFDNQVGMQIELEIYEYHSGGNEIYCNEFRNVVNMVTYESVHMNHMDNELIGNYWSDYTGSDSNGDGIGDSPYAVNTTEIDPYPYPTNPFMPPGGPYSLGSVNIDKYPLINPLNTVITVPDDYATIQEAIDAAAPGYIVYVKSGIYNEHLVITKPITLKGENRENTIIDGNGYGNVIEIIGSWPSNLPNPVYLDNVQISGFTIKNGEVGLKLYLTWFLFVFNNNFDNQQNCPILNDSSYLTRWDSGYTPGGNFWADYSGIDSNGDGIGDSPYTINAESIDRYPLMKPWDYVNYVANFSSNVTEGYVPLTVRFTDLSENATEWNWDFGDGTASTYQNPTHVYSVAGTYNVSLTVINMNNDTDSKIAPINVLGDPIYVGQYAYITTDSGSTLLNGTVYVIDISTNNVIGTVSVGLCPSGVAVTPDGTKVYVTNTESDSVSVIDTVTNTVVTTVPVGSCPQTVAVTPDGTKAYVPNSDLDSVSVIDTVTNAVIATVPVGLYPHGVAVNPDGTKVYVTNAANESVSVIDTATNTVTATVLGIPSRPHGIAVTPDGTKIYVTQNDADSVSVIDTATNTVIATVPVGSNPYTLAVTPDGTKVYVVNTNGNSVTVINTATNTVMATVPVGSTPIGVAVTPDGTKAYVENYNEKSLSVIDTSTNNIIASIPVEGYPTSWGQFIVSIPAQESALPVANAGDDQTVNEGDIVSFSGNYTDAGNAGNHTIFWNFGDGSNESGTLTPTHIYADNGEYTVILTVTNNDGGVGTDTLVVTVNNVNPVVCAPAEQWNKTFGGTGWDVASSAAQTSDGGYIVAASTNLYGAWDAWLIKVDNNGNQKWNKTFGGPSLSDVATSVQQTSDGGYIIAGYTESYGAGSSDAWLIKVDSSGNHTWNKTFGGTGPDSADSVQQTSDGGYIIAGNTYSYNNRGYNAWLIKTDSSGNELWNKTFGGTLDDSATSVQQTSEGGYIIAGHTDSYGAGSKDAWLIKTDSSGNEQWNNTFGGTGYDAVFSVDQTSDGGYIIAGHTDSYGAWDAWLIKVDNNGNQKWNKTFGGPSLSDVATSVQQTSDGGYIIAGLAGGSNAWLIKVDSNGNHTWNKTFGGTGYDQAYSVDQTSDGGYIIAGNTYSYGAGSSDAWLIKVAPENNPPVANAGDDKITTRGTDVTFDASASTDDIGIASYSWDFDASNGITSEATGKTATKAYTTAGTYTVTLTVTDTNAQTSTDTLQVVVSIPIDNPPVAIAGDDQTVNEGDIVSFSGNYTDAGNAGNHTIFWNFGDGSNESGTLTPTHIYADNGEYTVTLTVTDSDGGIGTDTLTVTVNNVNPVVGEIVSPLDPHEANSSITVSSTFTDVGILDTHTAVWDWGDGNTTAGIIVESNGAGNVTGEHVYANAGIYWVKLTVTDDDGTTTADIIAETNGTDTVINSHAYTNAEIYWVQPTITDDDSGSSSVLSEYYTVIYDPEGGFVTGGGWINSPVGAYVADPSLTGKATFGFVSKYQKGATVPTGNTEFQFKVANLNFKSTSYDWLVVAGAQAKYKGTGTINGAGNYGFMLSAVDGAIKGDNIDKFRIKIWDKASGAIVYDNEIGVLEDAEPTTAIGGGSIVIHKVK